MKLTPITPSDTGLRALVLWNTVGAITYGEMPAGLAPISGMSGGIWIRRIREKVTLSILGAVTTTNNSMIDLPLGFYPRTAPFPTVMFRISSGFAPASVGAGKIYASVPSGTSIPSANNATYASILTWDVFDQFPTMYPGLPA